MGFMEGGGHLPSKATAPPFIPAPQKPLSAWPSCQGRRGQRRAHCTLSSAFHLSVTHWCHRTGNGPLVECYSFWGASSLAQLISPEGTGRKPREGSGWSVCVRVKACGLHASPLAAHGEWPRSALPLHLAEGQKPSLWAVNPGSRSVYLAQGGPALPRLLALLPLCVSVWGSRQP